MAKGQRRVSLRIAIAMPCEAWLRRVPDAKVRCRRFARAALAAAGFDQRRIGAETAEISLVLGDDELLRQLNRDFRGKDKPTNVLSFPALSEAALTGVERSLRPPFVSIGDIAIAYETTACEAREQGKTLAAHLSHLVVHGILHLLGYDHLSKAQANEMESLETAVLARFGLSDPYRARAPRTRRPAPGGQRRVPRQRRAVQSQR